MATKMGNIGQILNALIDTDSNTLRVSIENIPVTIDVSALTDSIKIADAAGVAATITDVAGKKSLDVNVTDITLSHTNDSVRLGDGGSNLATVTATGALKVDNSGVTQPVSGTFYQATQPVSLASAPTTPVTGTFWQATQPVSLASAPTTPVTGTFWQATQPISGTVTANAGSGTQAVSAAALPLPSGASTSAKQDTGNTSVGNIDTKTPALGQALMAASSPVVIASNQSAVPVSGTFFQATQPVSLASAPTTPVTGTFWQATQPVSLASAPTTPVTGTFWQATQPVSLASAPTTPVTGTFWQATQPVSGTFFQATQPVSIASMPSTPVTGTFWQATQPISNANLDVALSTRLKPADTLTAVTTVGTITNPVAATQSGTWTVQPGNTANTTPWLVTASLGNATGKTNVLKTGTLVTTATTADQVILTYTVTAGKTFYVQYLEILARLTVLSATATILGTASLETPSGTKDITVSLVQPTTAEVQRHQYVFSEPIPVAAAAVIRVVCTPAAATSTTWVANFGGYEK